MSVSLTPTHSESFLRRIRKGALRHVWSSFEVFTVVMKLCGVLNVGVRGHADKGRHSERQTNQLRVVVASQCTLAGAVGASRMKMSDWVMDCATATSGWMHDDVAQHAQTATTVLMVVALRWKQKLQGGMSHVNEVGGCALNKQE